MASVGSGLLRTHLIGGTFKEEHRIMTSPATVLEEEEEEQNLRRRPPLHHMNSELVPPLKAQLTPAPFNITGVAAQDEYQYFGSLNE